MRMFRDKPKTAAETAKMKYQPRNLTAHDRAGWADALEERAKTIKPATVRDVQILMRNRNPVRWARLQKDFRWLQKEMQRAKLNPEDARFLL